MKKYKVHYTFLEENNTIDLSVVVKYGEVKGQRDVNSIIDIANGFISERTGINTEVLESAKIEVFPLE